MYVLQKNYEVTSNSEVNRRLVVVITPSDPHQEITRFIQLAREVVKDINDETKGEKWKIQVLNQSDEERSPASNFNAIYDSEVIIAECTEKKPNIFYMIGLAHALGRHVCSCYKVKDGEKADIPFNVQGRQSLTYSISTTRNQKEFRYELKDWIKKHE